MISINILKTFRYNGSKHMSRKFVTNITTKRFDSNKTHFGYQNVTHEEKSQKVHDVFRSVAQKYDLMNDIMSLGIHRYWKRQLIRYLKPLRDTTLLDTCGGTGDIAHEFVTYMRNTYPTENTSKVIVCDINEEMLNVGQSKAKQWLPEDSDRIQWVLGDAMALPFDDNSFDAYTVGFGIRNVVDIDKTLSEAHRVLKPGAVFTCLEFSKLQNPLISKIYDLYSFEVIPVLGEILAKDWKSYQYLVESIRQFPPQNQFKSMIESVGFTFVEYINFLDGIATIHIGYKSDH
ncbi:2-methoxy-6-polyprenyl-1,4-benzoquinol methylase, mitochondrial-like [Oppia nitens]|uniref:2-methoxy-6-polyprenyl-1,4-benzoquinol methylase, mitochondrial-like n=1 Tax=Oppia nitens TaxID=1686743 RepID=UPI0023DB473C|nr:2-methoxy-6-polyprenyl-1,4-benzoquinol methylase, mitochondrial-like [Oppia nitens]